LTSAEIIKVLKYHYSDSRQFAVFEELRIGTGGREYNRKLGRYEPNNPEQRIDLWVINCYKSKNFEKTAFEVKVSRSDFLAEIKNPHKRRQALELTNHFYFAAPRGLIKPDEIPEECGLVEIKEGSLLCRWVKKAPYREVGEPTWGFTAALARRIQKQMRLEVIS
jgi:hypothetical protein